MVAKDKSKTPKKISKPNAQSRRNVAVLLCQDRCNQGKEGQSAFHRVDDAVAANEPDQATNWSIEATKYADAAATEPNSLTKLLPPLTQNSEKTNDPRNML